MNIKLDDNYKVTADSKQYTLQKTSVAKSGDNEGKEVATSVGFYRTIAQALKSYKELSIRESDVTTIDEVLGLVRSIDTKIDEILGDN